MTQYTLWHIVTLPSLLFPMRRPELSVSLSSPVTVSPGSLSMCARRACTRTHPRSGAWQRSGALWSVSGLQVWSRLSPGASLTDISRCFSINNAASETSQDASQSLTQFSAHKISRLENLFLCPVSRHGAGRLTEDTRAAVTILESLSGPSFLPSPDFCLVIGGEYLI